MRTWIKNTSSVSHNQFQQKRRTSLGTALRKNAPVGTRFASTSTARKSSRSLSRATTWRRACNVCWTGPTRKQSKASQAQSFGETHTQMQARIATGHHFFKGQKNQSYLAGVGSAVLTMVGNIFGYEGHELVLAPVDIIAGSMQPPRAGFTLHHRCVVVIVCVNLITDEWRHQVPWRQ